MTAREFFQHQELFEVMTEDMKELALMTLEAIDKDPRRTVLTLSVAANKYPTHKKLFLMGIFAGFAAADPRFIFPEKR